MRRARLRRRYGHASTLTAIRRRYSVSRVHLNRGGYDPGGRYYGVGAPLYEVYDKESNLSVRVRASSAAKARDAALSDPRKWGGWR